LRRFQHGLPAWRRLPVPQPCTSSTPLDTAIMQANRTRRHGVYQQDAHAQQQEISLKCRFQGWCIFLEPAARMACARFHSSCDFIHPLSCMCCWVGNPLNEKDALIGGTLNPASESFTRQKYAHDIRLTLCHCALMASCASCREREQGMVVCAVGGRTKGLYSLTWVISESVISVREDMNIVCIG
jgi:hypothetical protein